MNNRNKRYRNYINDECNDSDHARMSDTLKEFDLQDDENESLRDFDAEIDEELSSRLMSNIHYEIVEKQRHKRRKRIQSVGVIIVMSLLIGITQLMKPRLNHSGISNTFTENKTTLSNLSDTIAVLSLPDHSIVYLSPQSHITYTANYNANQRNIYLDGKAIFEVSKDPTRPFNVFSGKIVTTAIGTKFSVSERTDNIFIKLIQGKILVRKNTTNAEDHFLVAGNSINYNIKDDFFTAILRTAKPQIKEHSKLAKKVHHASPAAIIKLDNEPLAGALDMIAQKYEVEIEYSPLDIKNINIIASLDISKPVYRILNSIALMNNLKVVELGDKQYILDRVR